MQRRRRGIKFTGKEKSIIRKVLQEEAKKEIAIDDNHSNQKKTQQVESSSLSQNLFGSINISQQNRGDQENPHIFIEWGQKVSNYPLYKILLRILSLLFIGACIMQSTKTKQWVLVGEIVEKITQVFFACGFFIEILNYRKQKMSYLVFEFVMLVSGVSAFFVEDRETIRYLKALRSLKFLVIFKFFKILEKPMKEFIHAWKRVCNILIPVILFTYLFAVIGLFSFVDLQYKKCRHPENKLLSDNWTVYEEEVFLCGERECPSVDGVQYECLNPIDYDVNPNSEQLQNLAQGNGLLKYSNIFYAFFSTFKQIFVTGSSRVIILYKQAVNSMFVTTFFFSFIYFMPYIYINIFYGVLITDKQEKTDEELQKKSSTKEQLNSSKGNKSQAKITTSVLNTLPNQEQNLTISNFYIQSRPNTNYDRGDRTPQICSRKSRFSLNIFEEGALHQITNIKIEELESKREEESEISEIKEESQQKQTSRKEQQSCKSVNQVRKEKKPSINALQLCNFILVILCTINLSLQFEGQSKQFEFATDCTSVGIYLLYLILMCFQIGKIVRSGQMQNTFLLDMCIFLGCTIGMIYEGAVASSFEEFLQAQSLFADIGRCLIYLRIFIVFTDNSLAKALFGTTMNIFFQGFYAVRYFLLCWVTLVIMLSVIGFHLHHDKTLLLPNGELDLINGSPSRISFTDFYHSFIFTILIIYDQEWDIFMFQEYLGSGFLAVFWIFVLLIVGLIMFSKYLMCLEAKYLGEILEHNENLLEEKEKTEMKEQSFSSSQRGINQISPLNDTEENQETEKFNDQNLCRIRMRRVKNLLRKILESRVYQILKILFLLSVCISEAALTPHVPINSSTYISFSSVNKVEAIFFLIDLILNGISYGFICSDDCYLAKSHLNKLNLLICIVEVLLFTPLSNLYIFYRIEKIRTLRVFLLLKIRYDANWEMRIMIRSLLRLMPKLIQLLVYSLLMYYFFALLLCKFYKNDSYYCDNPSGNGLIETKDDCLNWGGDWVKLHFNFSTPFHSLLYLFLVATMEGWSSLMTDAMDFNGQFHTPSYNANQHIQILFVLFFFIGNIFVLNSIISVSLYNYKKLKEKETGQNQLTDEERTWLNTKLQIMRLKPQIKSVQPQNCCRKILFKMCKHKYYMIWKSVVFFILIAGASCITSGTKHNEQWLFFWGFIGTFMFFQYVFELLAFGCQWSSSFIFETVIFTYSFIYYSAWRNLRFTGDEFIIFGGLFIFSQICRYIKLLDEIPFASKMLHTILTILPRSFNIFFLMVIVVYMYAILGMELFSFLKPGEELDESNQNYHDISKALFSLMKFSQMESPIAHIQDASQALAPNSICYQTYSYQDYEKYGQNGCGSSVVANFFFLSFHLIYSLLLMPTFLAFVVDTYDDIRREENAHITKHLLKKVVDIWTEKDPQATGLMQYRQFWTVTLPLLHIYSDSSEQETDQWTRKKIFLHKLSFPIYENDNGVLSLNFHEVIEGLTKIYIQKNLNSSIRQNRQKQTRYIKKTQKGQRNSSSRWLRSLVLIFQT